MTAPQESPTPAAGRPPAVHPWAEVLERAATLSEWAAGATSEPTSSRAMADAAQLRELRDALARLESADAGVVRMAAEQYDRMQDAATHPHEVRGCIVMGLELRTVADWLDLLASGPTPPGADARPAAPVTPHDSDCALHNAPAYPAGPCDCTASDAAWDAYAPRWNGCVYICDQGHAHDARDGVACNRASRAASTPPGADALANERRYPCACCGLLRTKAEGGTTFTVCDRCWDAKCAGDGSCARCGRSSTPTGADA